MSKKPFTVAHDGDPNGLLIGIEAHLWRWAEADPRDKDIIAAVTSVIEAKARFRAPQKVSRRLSRFLVKERLLQRHAKKNRLVFPWS